MSQQVVIENPILNSPFAAPNRHFRFANEGITNEIVEGRRASSYFSPIARPRKRGPAGQLSFYTEWTQDRIEENKVINQIRDRVARWRQIGRPGITPTTTRLLGYWTRPDRERPLFFCQIEALETVIYITEAANRLGDSWIENALREANAGANPLLYRMAFKMATGSGKTVVMAMLIAWHTLNKRANPQDARFGDSFLIVTPGITIRDRLRVLLPNDTQNYYHYLDLVPPDSRADLGQAKMVITNFHSLKLHERGDASRLTKSILAPGQVNPFMETPDQMARRVCRSLGTKKNIVVLNDEAHHCYRPKPDEEVEPLTGDERKEVAHRDEEARVWIAGLEAIKAKLGVRVVYDLSATPFFLRGSGYPEGTLFPWVVSDFALIDAIEAGIVKIPRVPVADNAMSSDQPTYRDLWPRIRDDLPKKGRRTAAVGSEIPLPAELEGALLSLYSNYEKSHRLWEQNTTAHAQGLTPPVFIVVCNNTNVSKQVFDYIAGWERTVPDGKVAVVSGRLPLFSNATNGRWLARPNTILVDSEQLESGEGMSPEFKKLAATEIEEFKADYQARFPGRNPDDLTDEDLLREVMNTVGKQGRLGEGVKCVVSVSMLTEGWDANTVTHILGVRAFGTQLLCEQVVGRALRRMSYTPNTEGLFDPEYAEVYGVPFSFLPCSGSAKEPRPGPLPVRVRALEARQVCEIRFPRLVGYRFDVPLKKLTAQFDANSVLPLSTANVPTLTENAPIVGESSIHRLDDLEHHRVQEVEFALARRVLDNYYRDDAGAPQPWLFPQILTITRQWMAQCLICKDGTFPQMLLLLSDLASKAADKIHRAIMRSAPPGIVPKPILECVEKV